MLSFHPGETVWRKVQNYEWRSSLLWVTVTSDQTVQIKLLNGNKKLQKVFMKIDLCFLFTSQTLSVLIAQFSHHDSLFRSILSCNNLSPALHNTSVINNNFEEMFFKGLETMVCNVMIWSATSKLPVSKPFCAQFLISKFRYPERPQCTTLHIKTVCLYYVESVIQTGNTRFFVERLLLKI